ncbi:MULTISPECIES: hypothetical protein [unclassified Microcoleus]|uniref:hypothetical protein n=1 Tax=unclassified Microcoleus TaxID=2642155 RepID=UPI0025DEAEA5|nr:MULTISPECIES: hypothetical protein [unclassified Microcoleus]
MTTATKIPQAYAEIVEFFAAGATPESILNFQLSEEAKEHIADLIYAHNNEGLSREENIELDNFLVVEHLLRLIKAVARKHVVKE